MQAWRDERVQREKLLENGEPCEHPGCLLHLSHPCGGCGRIGGVLTVESLLRRYFSLCLPEEVLVINVPIEQTAYGDTQAVVPIYRPIAPIARANPSTEWRVEEHIDMAWYVIDGCRFYAGFDKVTKILAIGTLRKKEGEQ